MPKKDPLPKQQVVRAFQKYLRKKGYKGTLPIRHGANGVSVIMKEVPNLKDFTNVNRLNRFNGNGWFYYAYLCRSSYNDVDITEGFFKI